MERMSVPARAGRAPHEGFEFEVGEEPPPAMFRAIADTCVNPFAIIDRSGVFRWVGRSMEELLGWPPDELVGKTVDTVIAPWSLPDVLDAVANLQNTPSVIRYGRGSIGQPADLLCRDGSTVHCNVMATPPAQTGTPYHVVFARRATFEQALDHTLEAIAEHAPLGEVVGHLITSLEQTIPGCLVTVGDGWQGDRFATVFGRGSDLLVDEPRSPWARALASNRDVVYDNVESLPPRVAAVARARGLTACWVHPVTVGNEPTPAALVLWRADDGAPPRFVRVALNRVGQLLRLTLQWDRSHRELEFAATHDTLTGVANRHAFVCRLTEIAKPAEGDAAVLFLDLDDFKPVNDRFGHLVGDRVLRTIADRLAGALRPGDLVARLGGDEFAVLCERVAAADDVAGVAQRLLSAVAETVVLDGDHAVRITASIGVTELGHGDDPESILARADSAMRAAKSAGGARWNAVAAPTG
jgi:diguanylate cyclase (GGDEF)-like protein/PAS domain S-box-containing protein